jgi:calnexin
MRFTAAAAAISTALLAGSVYADAQSVLSDASSSISSVASEASASGSSLVESATSGPELPTFTVSCQYLVIRLRGEC